MSMDLNEIIKEIVFTKVRLGKVSNKRSFTFAPNDLLLTILDGFNQVKSRGLVEITTTDLEDIRSLLGGLGEIPEEFENDIVKQEVQRVIKLICDKARNQLSQIEKEIGQTDQPILYWYSRVYKGKEEIEETLNKRKEKTVEEKVNEGVKKGFNNAFVSRFTDIFVNTFVSTVLQDKGKEENFEEAFKKALASTFRSMVVLNE